MEGDSSMNAIEKLIEKFRGNTAGLDFNLCDWDSKTLFEKCRYTFTPLSKAEKSAVEFFEEVGKVLNQWHPIEKWKRPYGKVLNETRKLH